MNEIIIAYLAEAHRHDLLREVRQDALAAKAHPHTGGMRSAALLLASDLLLAAGHRLRPRLAERPLVHFRCVAACDITVVRPFDDGYIGRVACLDT